MGKKCGFVLAEGLESRRLLSAVPTPAHVVVVIEENRGYGQIIGNSNAPYINSLSSGGATFTKSDGVGHPSLLNYLALFSGSTQGLTDDTIPAKPLPGPDLASDLKASGRSFAGYSEGLPAVGSLVLEAGEYVRRHNPWSLFSDVPASDNLPFTSFPEDFNSLPTVSFVIPNLLDDMHSSTINAGDRWLQNNLGAYAAWAKTHNSLLIFTCDEDDGSSAANQIPTIFYGQPVKAGAYGELINHFNVCATIEDMYGLPRRGSSATAAAITDVWQQPAGNVIPASATQVTYLSALPWVSATVGYGAIQLDKSILGNGISLHGATYSRGIGTHAKSKIVYNLGGLYSGFISDIGIDDEVAAEGASGSVNFQVLGDGKVLYNSGVLTSSSARARITLNVSGVKQLTLLATNGVAGTVTYDHADWAAARLLAVPAKPSAPTNLTAVAAGSSKIYLGWQNTANDAAGFEIDRSPDGAMFTPLTTVGATTTSYSDSGLLASRKYYYRVEATSALGLSAASGIASATTLSPTSTTTYLSSLTPVSATTGWGTIQHNLSVKGNPLTIRGVAYASGIGTHANSKIVYNIAGKYSTFAADIGIDDDALGQGSVNFQVLGDGKVLFNSGTLSGISPTIHVNLSVAGIQKLTLIVTSTISGTNSYDHADWAGARLLTA